MTAANFAHEGITRSTPAVVPTGYRLVQRRTPIGSGTATLDAALAVILRWGTKTRAGFRVEGPVELDREYVIRFGPVREPVRVSWVSAQGFGYVTLPGHPLSGEEAFLVERDADDRVWFVGRSVSRPDGAWRLLTPLLRLAQAFFVRRYGRVMQS